MSADTDWEVAAGGLTEFRERLTGGVAPALAASRPADFCFRDGRALAGWPGHALDPLSRIRDEPWSLGDNQPTALIDDLAEQMRSNSPLLYAVLYSPALVLGRLLRLYGSEGQGLVDSWIGMCWIAEAAWRAVTEKADEDAGLLLPPAARLRFLVLSEPSRWRAERECAWWGWGPDEVFGESGALDRAFGPESWDLLVIRAQEARRLWMQCLDAYQSHPLLSQAQPADLEAELSALVFRHGRPRFKWTRLLGLSVEQLATRVPLTAEDKGFIGDIAERHLLPRFALLTVARIALYDDRPAWRRVSAAWALLVASCALAAVGCAAALLVVPAVALAVACYALICLGVGIMSPRWGLLWVLRMPAASAVGLIALVALLPASGWLTGSPGGWLAVPVLVAVSFGYLLVEARNHGVAPAVAPLRALLVAVLGAVHALLVSLIGLVAVAAAYVQDSGHLRTLWHHPGYRHAGMVLALAAAWCLTVGVFSQILWDDRPVTAPLAHLSWRSR